jgi:hypothetical protein
MLEKLPTNQPSFHLLNVGFNRLIDFALLSIRRINGQQQTDNGQALTSTVGAVKDMFNVELPNLGVALLMGVARPETCFAILTRS